MDTVPGQFTGMPELEIWEKDAGAVRYAEHGYPHWRVRWHYHDEYELHLIVASEGRMFVGDYVGGFQPGTLVLTGPRLPHNWISQTEPDRRYALRDRFVHFDHDVITAATELLPELRSLLPLMARASYGVDFHGMGRSADRAMDRIREASGPTHLAYFLEFMDELTASENYRLLSTAQLQLPADQSLPEKVDRVVNYALENYHGKLSSAEAAELLGMSEGHFSRFFRKSTGNSFTDFVNRLRIGRACDLLAQSDDKITSICTDVGFNNVANFNRRFQQYKQMTPRDYRAAARERYRLNSA